MIKEDWEGDDIRIRTIDDEDEGREEEEEEGKRVMANTGGGRVWTARL